MDMEESSNSELLDEIVAAMPSNDYIGLMGLDDGNKDILESSESKAANASCTQDVSKSFIDCLSEPKSLSQSEEHSSKSEEFLEELKRREKEGEPIIGYLHNLSPMKVSANENNYFDVSVQMKEKTIHAVCFSPEKMKPMKANWEASSPVKISNFSIKRNRFTHDDEMHINKRTKLSEADVSEVDFNFVEEKVDEVPFSTVSDLVGKDSTGQVNIVGRVRLQGVPETIKSNGKTLIKQDGVLTDASGSIRIVFWQSDIQKIESGLSYEFKKAILKNYDGRNYITINRQTILLSSDVEVTRDDDEKVENVSQLSLPADAVEKVTSYLCCNKCNSSLLQNDNQKVIKCSNCNSAQLKSKSKKLVVAKVLLMKDEQKVSLAIFDEKLRELYCIYKRQENAFAKPYCQLGDDEIAEFLLIVEAVVCYNSRLNVLAING